MITMATVPESKTWGQLKRGDVFTCPGDGRPCKVKGVWPSVPGKVMIRTDRHDHVGRPKGDLVQKTAAQDFAPEETAGYRAHTRARSTGTTVYVVDGYEQGLSSPGSGEPRWYTICDDHNGCVGHYSLADAKSHMSHPEAWCEVCNGTDNEEAARAEIAAEEDRLNNYTAPKCASCGSELLIGGRCIDCGTKIAAVKKNKDAARCFMCTLPIAPGEGVGHKLDGRHWDYRHPTCAKGSAQDNHGSAGFGR